MKTLTFFFEINMTGTICHTENNVFTYSGRSYIIFASKNAQWMPDDALMIRDQHISRQFS